MLRHRLADFKLKLVRAEILWKSIIKRLSFYSLENPDLLYFACNVVSVLNMISRFFIKNLHEVQKGDWFSGIFLLAPRFSTKP